MEELDILNQELSEKMVSLQTKLDNCKIQKEVASIIRSLKDAVIPRPGFTCLLDLNVSRDGFFAFIGLLNSDEYLRGFTSGGKDIFGEHPIFHKYDKYYLTLGPGIVLELSFCETEMRIHNNSIKESELIIISYQNSQNLNIRAVGEEVPTLEILTQDGSRIFDSITTEEFLTFNGKQLNEAVIPISFDDLTNRFFCMMGNRNHSIAAQSCLFIDDVREYPEQEEPTRTGK